MDVPPTAVNNTHSEFENILKEEPEHASYGTGRIFSVAYGIIAVLAFLSNFLFCVALTRKRRMLKKAHDVLIYSLAVVDMFTGLFIIITPNYVISITSFPVPSGLAGEIFCRVLFSKFFIFTFGKSSILTITCLAVERWLAVVKPWRHQIVFSVRRLYYYLGIILISCIIIQSYKFFYVKYAQNTCVFISLPLEKNNATLVIATYISLTFFLPTTITWTAFFRTFMQINKCDVLRGNRGKRLLLRMCAITSFMMTVCWFPTEVSYLINRFGFPILNFGTPFREFTVALALANSIVNPWIYVFCHRRYRKEMKALFRFCQIKLDVNCKCTCVGPFGFLNNYGDVGNMCLQEV